MTLQFTIPTTNQPQYSEALQGLNTSFNPAKANGFTSLQITCPANEATQITRLMITVTKSINQKN